MEELDKLIEVIEAGDWSWAAPHLDAIVGSGPRVDALSAYHGSLEAAKSLHEALLDSGFHAEIQACCTRPRVRVVRGDEIHDGHEQESEACSWLIAILKAHRSDLSKGAEQ